MALTFNTAEPCIPGEHYMLSPAKRLGRIIELIDEKKYFTGTRPRHNDRRPPSGELARHHVALQHYRRINHAPDVHQKVEGRAEVVATAPPLSPDGPP